jgi:hypothetical protein
MKRLTSASLRITRYTETMHVRVDGAFGDHLLPHNQKDNEASHSLFDAVGKLRMLRFTC